MSKRGRHDAVELHDEEEDLSFIPSHDKHARKTVSNPFGTNCGALSDTINHRDFAERTWQILRAGQMALASQESRDFNLVPAMRGSMLCETELALCHLCGTVAPTVACGRCEEPACEADARTCRACCRVFCSSCSVLL
jgi:hypothetical protein